jgi:death-on-curing protein
MLLEGGYDINAKQDEKYYIVITASTGEIRFEEIKNWIHTHVIQKNDAEK